jgi:V/A-type H+/Na+-transporting ATPase subunit D
MTTPMRKIRLTKYELKRQKDDLKRFNRFLPTLELKQRQLIQEIARVQDLVNHISAEIQRLEDDVSKWVDVFAEDVSLLDFFRVKEIKTDISHLAGVDLPHFHSVEFEDTPYDLFQTPVWVDKGIAACKEMITRKAHRQVAQKRLELLKHELEITVQRINLFEKVKIPEARKNIRTIQIRLGDVQTAEVVRGKIAKAKIIERKQGVTRT